MFLRDVNGVQILRMGKEEIALFAGTCGHGFLSFERMCRPLVGRLVYRSILHFSPFSARKKQANSKKSMYPKNRMGSEQIVRDGEK